jgi:hypothetical protein
MTIHDNVMNGAAPDHDDPLENEPPHAWEGRLGAGQRTIGFKRSTEWFVDTAGIPTRLHGDLPQ